MRPEFEERRPVRQRYGSGSNESKTVAFRLPVDFASQIDDIAYIEGDTFTGIVLEGLFRVLDDRHADPAFMEKLAGIDGMRIAELQAQLDELRKQHPKNPEEN